LKIDLNIAVGFPAELLESLPERRSTKLPLLIIFRVKHQHADPTHLVGSLRARRERPRRSSANKRNKIAPLHMPPPALAAFNTC
jgi:hypothetical protein